MLSSILCLNFNLLHLIFFIFVEATWHSADDDTDISTSWETWEATATSWESWEAAATAASSWETWEAAASSEATTAATESSGSIGIIEVALGDLGSNILEELGAAWSVAVDDVGLAIGLTVPADVGEEVVGSLLEVLVLDVPVPLSIR